MKIPLQSGDTGEDVKLVQRLLASQGHFDGAIGGNFGPVTKKAVLYFQMTHLGQNGKPLEVDGVVGPDTWWALQNPIGVPQSSGIKPAAPSSLHPSRLKVLQVALAEHKAG